MRDYLNSVYLFLKEMSRLFLLSGKKNKGTGKMGLLDFERKKFLRFDTCYACKIK